MSQAVSFDRRGSGPTVVLVHGLGSRWQVFEPVIDLLAAHRDVISVDLPGFGGTPLFPSVRPGPSGYAEWLTAWLADLGVERPHLVGNSMGGAIALEMGRSGAASAVTAFSPVGFYADPGLVWVRGLLTAMRGFTRVTEPVVARAVDHPVGRAALLFAFFGHPTQVDPEAARGDVRGLVGSTAFAAARDDFENYRWDAGQAAGALPEIPVTVAWGTRDLVLTHRTQSVRARAALPFARHLDLPGAGHLPFSDDPHRCAWVVLSNRADDHTHDRA